MVQVVSEVGRQTIPFVLRDFCRQVSEDVFDRALRGNPVGAETRFSAEIAQDLPGGLDLIRGQAVYKLV